jgi:GNAT superfamily N-acetyltransferase
MIIRKAKSSDIDQIYQCFLEMEKTEDISAKKSAQFLFDARKRRKNFEQCAKKELLREIRERNSIYLVAVENDVVLGYSYGSISKNKNPFFDFPKLGYFNALLVRKKYQGKGIAKLLYLELENWFKEQKCKLIYLDVFFHNPAKNIYPKWGYKFSNEIMMKELK